MTITETIAPMRRATAPAGREPIRSTADRRTRTARTRPTSTRPAGAPLRYAGSGTMTSRAPHGRSTSPRAGWATIIGLALLSALITGWLGLVAQFGEFAAGQPAAMPEQLGVVRVADGESLAQLAARVAPDVPPARVVARIRELNGLDSAALAAGRTLIAPIG